MTKPKHKVQVDIKPTGVESAVVYAPFDEALEALAERGYAIISLPQNAKLRIQQGEQHYISRNGNWTREGVIWIPRGKPRLVRDSPILYSAKEATQAHRNGKEFYPAKDAIEMALADSVDFPEGNMKIPTNRFGEDALTVFAFGGKTEARNYGEFLRQAGIKEMPVWAVSNDYVNKQDKPFARQMWFWYLGGGSGLDGIDRALYGNRMRGVLNKTSEAGSQIKKGIETGDSPVVL